MKARVIKDQPISTSSLYRITHKAPLIHGAMKYKCEKCGKEWWMSLEVGVEDHGKNGRPHQPCPFCIPCECGGIANDISGYISAPAIETLNSGVKYFAYDKSGKEDACGKMAIYISDKQSDVNYEENAINESIARAMEICRPFDARDIIIQQREEIKRLTTLAELGNMRANDYRVMRDRALNAEKEVERLRAFKSYFDSLYGTGVDIANWHKNGELEPFDNFYDSAIEEMNECKTLKIKKPEYLDGDPDCPICPNCKTPLNKKEDCSCEEVGGVRK